MANPDCKVIEKCIKDMLFSSFPNNSPILPIESKVKAKPSTFLVNDSYFVSNIEEEALSKPTNVPSIENKDTDSNVSKLIDVNVLTDFAAKHIQETNLNATDLVLNCENRILPHPELEDNRSVSKGQESQQNLSKLYDNISNEFKNFPLFLSMSDKPVFETPLSSGRSSVVNGSFVEDKTKDQIDKAKKKREKKKKKNSYKRNLKEKISERQNANKSSDASETSEEKELSNKNTIQNSEELPAPTKKKKKKKEPSGIKLKLKASSILSSVGREYTLSFPRESIDCRFTCHICNFNTEKDNQTYTHLKSRCHRKMKEESELDLMLPFLPQPLPDQITALTHLLNSTVTDVGLTEDDLNIRQDLILRIKSLITEHAPTCSVALVGSSITGIGFKRCAVDISLTSTNDDTIPDDLETIYEALVKDVAYTDVKSEFKQKRPCIIFTDNRTNLTCNLVLENGNTTRFTNLILFYVSFDKRVRPLGIAFRYWAKLCGIDNQDGGTLPSFCYTILLIYFLQQVKPPVLPVLEHEDFGESYSLSSLLTEYSTEKKWCKLNCDSIGELWVKLFHFYNFAYKIGQDVISINNSKRISCKDKNWSTKFYAIEDPFNRRNLGYVIPTYQVCHYIQQCFIRTYKYFAFPQLLNGSAKIKKNASIDTLVLAEYLADYSLTKAETSEESEISEKEESSVIDGIDLEDHDPDIAIENFMTVVGNLSLDETDEATVSEEISEPAKITESTTDSAAPSGNDAVKTKKDSIPNQDIKFSEFCSWDIVKKKSTANAYYYAFHSKLFTGDKLPPLVCRTCKSVGHTKKECLHDELPIPCNLPPMTHQLTRMVEKCLFYITEKHKVTEVEVKFVKDVMQEIQNSIQEIFPDAKLSLFGSFCNGFGFKNNSDMDFCLTFKGCTDKKDLNSKEIIQKVAEQLNKYPKLGNVLSVTSAKVPIVKFTYTETQTEGDISLYNTLALANTEMLEAYSKIDERVQILGFNLKHFAKILGICDASRGSLSSYAYLLMVIFFLQQRNPPVIPVLQELNNEDEETEIIEGWNVWWCKDIDKLKKIWPDFGKNNESVADLWVGLFTFYTNEFNWKEYAVCIRQKKLLKRFKKLWYSDKRIAIEDPFDLKHNLGAGLTKKMNTYIFKCFHRARERFGIQPQRMPNIFGREWAYFFDRRFLNSGADPPQDRGCHKCGKIGHMAKSCTQLKCSFCFQIGHSYGKCPRKPKKSKEKKKNIQDESSAFDNRKSPEKKKVVDSHMKNQNAQSSGGKNSALHNQALNVPDKKEEQSRNSLLGIPIHRFPPGFNARPRPFMHAPPGFNPSITQSNYQHFGPQHQPATQPFPKSAIRSDLSYSTNHFNQIPPSAYGQSPPKSYSQSPSQVFYNQSPPKPFSSAPPKTFSGHNMYQTLPDPSWQANPRHPLQATEHHPGVERHPQWQNVQQFMSNVPPPKYGLSHPKRTTSGNISNYSNQQ